MKIVLFLILSMTAYLNGFSQKAVYLKKNKTGHLKKLRSKTIFDFDMPCTKGTTGRIISITDSSLLVGEFREFTKSDTVEINIKDINKITNRLINKSGLAHMAGWSIVAVSLGVFLLPVVWIAEGGSAARELITFMGVIYGGSAILLSPYLLKRKFDTKRKWTIIVQ